MLIGELGPDREAEWDRFVMACPEATFFHRAGWRTVIERAFGHPAHFLYAERNGRIAGVLPLVRLRGRPFANGLISLPFCVGGGIAAGEDEGARQALDARAVALMAETGADWLEYRDPARPIAGRTRREGLYASFARPIERDEAANLKQIPRKQRAVLRKALEASDLACSDDADPDRFHALYAESVRNLGTPVFSKRYLETLMRVFGQDCEVATVRKAGRPVAGVMTFWFRDRVMPYYAGARPEARGLGAHDLLYWRLMRRAVEERDCAIFDFGRSKVGSGPWSFKRNWGFEPRPVAHEFRLAEGIAQPDLNPNNPRYRAVIAAWKRLPLPVANLLG
ncbi:MAG: FemAB family PEP-CTERM system-associated protein, partial [Alphaproteobacteria bacterium]|nr:FemAB family PEP-CTERM system-associated protein [Alphaproteobacteria bacterium]